MTTEGLKPLNVLTSDEFEKRYREIISMGVVAVEHHLASGTPMADQTVGEALSVLYDENPDHHQSLVDRQSLEFED